MAFELVEETPRYELVDTPPAKIGREGLGEAVQAVAGDFNPLTQMAVGAKATWDDAALKMKQAAGVKLTPEDENVIAANRALRSGSNPALAGTMMTAIGAYPLVAPDRKSVV